MKKTLKLLSCAGLCLMFTHSLARTDETVKNGASNANTEASQSPTAGPEEKSCSEKLTLEMATEVERLHTYWKTAITLCQNSSKAQGFTDFLKRFDTTFARARILHGEKLISSGLSELTEAQAAAEEKYGQELITATNQHTRGPQLFCNERLHQLEQDSLTLQDEKALCERVEKTLLAENGSRSADEKITPTSFTPTRVAEEQTPRDPKPVENSGFLKFNSGESRSLAGSNGSSANLSPKNSSPQRPIEALEHAVGTSKSPMENFFSSSLKSFEEKTQARNKSECIQQNASTATDSYWALRSRLKAASITCQFARGVDWQAQWQQFSNSNPVTGFKPSLPPGQTEQDYEQEQLRIARNHLAEQQRICENARFQQDFQAAVRLNAAQIQDQIAESLCEIP